MQAGIIDQGVELMLYGMGTVVVFLGLLVLATTLMSRFVGRYFPEAEPEPSRAAPPPPAARADDPQLLAVIGAAIHRYRSRR
ncbi:OadG family protein [Parahaliea mediterranea]|uniref:Probable oxaloacetate decarboxylase gamma chain n=1 Tax=Parahaliea mediterranea TaxID=651086 RepID=A0A939IM93_9GAMM|nr:OadG family transporter subunit [Parahaliea mediterranea]MBN7796772.1 OadG family protein [Parahaliea mediterranea]